MFADTARPSPELVSYRERMLLLAAAVFVVLNRVLLVLVRGDAWYSLWPVGVWLACTVGMHVVLNRVLPHRDPLITPLVMLLGGWGLTLVSRLAPPFEVRQTIWLAISVVALLAVVVLLPPHLRVLKRYRYTWLLAGVVLLAATLIFGVNPSGDAFAPRLWLGFRVIFFQPSEILKLLLIVFLASYLAEKREIIVTTRVKIGRWELPPPSYLAPMLLMWGFIMVLLIWQRDLGTASLFFLIFLAMLYVSTGQIGYVVGGLALLGAAGVVGYLLFDVVRLRVDTWINPWPEASDRAFQIVQSLLAFAAGGVFGRGVGLGAPTFIPVVHSDFVFAAIAEEWGLLGALGVVLCLAVLVLRALRAAISASRWPFHSLLAAGIGVSLGVQSLLIMAGVLKLAPLTGVTLPFVSYGGSSLLSSFIMIGLLLRITDAEAQASAAGGTLQESLNRNFMP
ncbi:MAG: FtsW/RodA/SpoVE family cell cycle protein [Aggregatilineales bacterium]|nr:FtsW/RodA/SpoVE family cell cycle protein [Aggregatilineales bacterium]